VDPDGSPATVVDRAIADLGEQPGALLPILHAVHDQLGYLPPASVERIAAGLNLSRAEVHGVISFYPDFRTTPPGRHVLRVCRAEACQAMGCDALVAHVEARHGAIGTTRADGALTTEPVYCLGNCALSPAVMLDGELHGRVSPDRLDELLAMLAGAGE